MAKSKIEPVAPPVDSEEHDKILTAAMERVTLAEKGHVAKCQEFVEFYRAWQGLPSKNAPRKESWQSDLRIPYINNHIRTLTARTVDPQPKMDYIPTMAVPQETVKLVEKVNDHFQWRDNLVVTQGRAMLHVALFGEAWLQTSWLYRTQKRTVNSTIEELMQGAPPRRDEQVVLDDRPHTNVIHPFDALPDPSPAVLEDARFVVVRSYPSAAQIRAKKRHQKPDGKLCGQYDNTDDPRLAAGAGKDRDVRLPNDLPEIHEARRQGNCEVLSIHDREKDTLTVIGNRCVVLRHGPRPYDHGDLPVSCIVTQPDVMRLGGISEVGKMMALQNYLWLVENQMLDNTRLSMDFILLVRDTIDNLDELKIGPGEVWPVRDTLNDVRPLQTPQQQMVGVEHIRDMRAQLQDAIGLSPFASGSDPTSSGGDNRTAFGIGSVIEEGNKSITNKLAYARALGLERVYQQSLELCQQFLTTPELVNIGGDVAPENWPRITARDLPGRYWVRNRAITEELNKQMKQGNASTILGALQPLLGQPLPSGKFVNPEPALDMLAQSIDRDVEDFLFTPPQQPMVDPSMVSDQPPTAGVPG